MRLKRLTIQNYKKIDYLEIDFPQPLMPHDPDVFILGSRNGGGKTSVLECCGLLVLAGIMQSLEPNSNRFKIRDKNRELDIANSIIRLSAEELLITGHFEKRNDSGIQECSISLTITKNGFRRPHFKGDISIFSPKIQPHPLIFGTTNNAILDILGFSNKLFVAAPLMFLNSYRRTEKTNPNAEMMIDQKASYYHNGRSSKPSSMHITNLLFKTQVANIFFRKNPFIDIDFDDFSLDSAVNTIEKLNQITRRYCGGEIGVLARRDNTFEIRIKHDEGQKSFPFDGLSSGQKEIITTLFLIWNNTQHQPSIVLIDEPELHLNSEWHRDFVSQLCKLAPQNQYILATHSEEIFRAVDPEYRAILVPDDGE